MISYLCSLSQTFHLSGFRSFPQIDGSSLKPANYIQYPGNRIFPLSLSQVHVSLVLIFHLYQENNRRHSMSSCGALRDHMGWRSPRNKWEIKFCSKLAMSYCLCCAASLLSHLMQHADLTVLYGLSALSLKTKVRKCKPF